MNVIRLFAIVAVAGAAFRGDAAPAANPWNLAGPPPHLVAHYIPWFSYGQATGWQGWKRSDPHAVHDPDKRLPDGRRDIASVLYPLIGPYASDDRAVVRYHLATMKAAGIQGVFIDWQGQDSIKLRTQVVLDEAAKIGMKVSLCYEEKTNFEWPTFRNPATRADAVQFALDDMRYIAGHYFPSPAFMRYDGKPMLFVWNGGGAGRLGTNQFTAEEWRSILSQMPEKVVFGSQGLDPRLNGVSEFRYSWFSPYPSANFGFDGGARKMIAAGRIRFFIAGICPGFDDTPVWGWGNGPRVVPRKGLSLLKATFDEAVKGDPDIIQLITWNDFNEGTVLEPTRQDGFDDLDAIATWMAARRHAKADLAAIRKPYLDYARNASPAQRAELPPGTPAESIASRKLTIEQPDYLHALVSKRNPANLLYRADSLESWDCGFTYRDATRATIEDGALRVDIGKVDDTAWHTFLLQADIPLEEGGKYVLRFEAKADQARPIFALMQTMGGATGDWHAVGLAETVALTTDWHEYRLPFTATRLIPNGSQFAFHLGQQTGSVWIKNLSLKPTR